ncbi:E3 ubiquitin/ISG15 ligase TRIM25-like [Saccostrea cucullata]|uniref:E3 ubiquitin/ISG15 ligase TRIM25-like n=1 Tax=Saccostrea cuccullata TaxID=36930 RepID=UPI002ED35003
MASSSLQNKLNVITGCFICLEKLKTPRCLPCSHLFCNSCLCSYIVTSCELKETPVGFPCPICREFIPSPDVSETPEDWAQRFPICNVVDKVDELRKDKFCAPCKRENEVETAKSFCVDCEELLCNNCVKYHKRSLASRAHVIVPESEPKAIFVKISRAIMKDEFCQDHPERKIELYCEDHSEVCCGLCVSIDHRMCDSVETIQKAAVRIKNSEEVRSILSELKSYEDKLLELREKEEENVIVFDDASDDIVEETKKLRQEIKEHLDRLENEHLGELGGLTKKGKEKLNKKIDSISERIKFTEHCKKKLQDLDEEGSVYYMKEFLRVKRSFKMLRKEVFVELKVKIESQMSKELSDMKKIEHFSRLSVKEKKVYGGLANFGLLYEFSIQKGYLSGGTFLPDGTFLFANCVWANCGIEEPLLKQPLFKYSMTSQDWDSAGEIEKVGRSFDAQHDGNECFVTLQDEKCISVISIDTFTETRRFSIEGTYRLHGLAIGDDYLYIACQSAILKYDKEGNFIHKYPVEGCSLYVTVTDRGHIVYSSVSTNTVTAMDEEGEIIWKYTSPDLVSTRGVDQDEGGKIYVAGRGSNNVHVLSGDGTFLGIIEDIPRPIFMKAKKGSNIFCVSSDWKFVRTYQMDTA